MSGKTLTNGPSTAVREAIHGLLLARPDLTALLDEHVVLLKARGSPRRVAVLSGGGAGHEPSHGGLVANGMLTAAVSGQVFASPTVAQIIAAIRAATSPSPSTAGPEAGGDGGGGGSGGARGQALLVVKNYTGDRMAFGLAAETARSHHGVDVDSVVVADDAAVGEGGGAPGGHIAGRRGLAGTVLVHKVAGALAAGGAPLAAVAAGARLAAACVVTFGASLTTCSVPSAPSPQFPSLPPPASRLAGPTQCELGLGIHGEPGRTPMDTIPTADELSREMVRSCVARLGEVGDSLGVRAERIPRLAAVPSSSPSPSLSTASNLPPTAPSSRLAVAVLVNDLGGLSHLETSLLAASLVREVEACPCTPRLRVARLFVGPLMTALDMKGVSLSLLPLDGRAMRCGRGSERAGWGTDTAAAGDDEEDAGDYEAGVAGPGWERCCPLGEAWRAAGGLAEEALGRADDDNGAGGAGGGSDGPWQSLDLASCLDFPTTCPSWPVAPGTRGVVPSATYEAPPPRDSDSKSPGAASFPSPFSSADSGALVVRLSVVRAVASAVCSSLSACADTVTRLDEIAGDGDAGLTFAAMGLAALRAVEGLEAAATAAVAAAAAQAAAAAGSGPPRGVETGVRLDAVLRAVGSAVAQSCGGTSGVLYALMLAAAAASATSQQSSLSASATPRPAPTMPAALGACLRAATDAASRYGRAKAGDRTFLDVLLPVAAALEGAAPPGAEGDAGRSVASAVCAAAEAGAAATASMAPSAGRAAYVPAAAVAGKEDAGAVATREWVCAFAKSAAAAE